MPFFVCILSKSRGTCFEATLLSQYRFRQRFRIFPSALSAAHSIKFARYISAGESIFSPNTPQFFHAHEPCPPKIRGRDVVKKVPVSRAVPVYNATYPRFFAYDNIIRAEIPVEQRSFFRAIRYKLTICREKLVDE